MQNPNLATASIPGKVGDALQLDGADDRTFVPHDLAFDFAKESFTAAFWMRWYTSSAWGRQRLRKNITNDNELIDYLKPIWRWTEALQNDFASRADWCVESYRECESSTERCSGARSGPESSTGCRSET